MTFIFVSNYINHHQIPFCEAMVKLLGDDFLFIQTEPMEEERVKMGWGVDLSTLPYVKVLYGDEQKALEQRIQDSDMVLFGWTEREDLVQKRLEAGKPVLRQSERLYREGQWKAVSPKGLLRKHHDHTRWRNAEAYLLCNGAYVASDFALVHAYPDKMFRWGYFPEEQFYTDEEMRNLKGSEELRILWAGRFMPLKHPEFAVHLAKRLKERSRESSGNEPGESSFKFRLDMIGAGELDGVLREYVRREQLEDVVSFHGFLAPTEVRKFMERAHIYLFTSNHLEGWGAVLNESMNSECAVVAGSEAGAVPYLFEQGKDGVIYSGEDEEDFIKKVLWLVDHPARREAIGKAAAAKIHAEWNASMAARRLVEFTEFVLGNTGSGFAGDTDDGPAESVKYGRNHQDYPLHYTVPASGPMSKALIVKPFIKVPQLL